MLAMLVGIFLLIVGVVGGDGGHTLHSGSRKEVGETVYLG